MSLSVPLQVLSLDGDSARCALRGVTREVTLADSLAWSVEVGDFVLVDGQTAVEKISEAEALSTWALYETIFGETAQMRLSE